MGPFPTCHVPSNRNQCYSLDWRNRVAGSNDSIESWNVVRVPSERVSLPNAKAWGLVWGLGGKLCTKFVNGKDSWLDNFQDSGFCCLGTVGSVQHSQPCRNANCRPQYRRNCMSSGHLTISKLLCVKQYENSSKFTFTFFFGGIFLGATCSFMPRTILDFTLTWEAWWIQCNVMTDIEFFHQQFVRPVWFQLSIPRMSGHDQIHPHWNLAVEYHQPHWSPLLPFPPNNVKYKLFRSELLLWILPTHWHNLQLTMPLFQNILVTWRGVGNTRIWKDRLFGHPTSRLIWASGVQVLNPTGKFAEELEGVVKPWPLPGRFKRISCSGDWQKWSIKETKDHWWSLQVVVTVVNFQM